MEDKQHFILDRLEQRHEKHLINKELNRDARNAENPSNRVLGELDNWIRLLSDKIESGDKTDPRDSLTCRELLDGLSADMQKLDKYFAEQSSLLTAYDVKVTQKNLLYLKSTFSELQDKLEPKRRFGFRGLKKKAQDDGVSKAEPVSKIETKIQPSGLEISDKTRESVKLFREQVLDQDVMLTRLTGCDISITGGCPATLHLTNLSKCVVNCSAPVKSSVYVENCRQCTLAVACQQLRAHSSTQNHLYIHVTSKGIVEDCHDITVAPFDLDLNEQLFKEAGLDMNTNNWNKLDDFNWLSNDTASPNWSVLPDDQRRDKPVV